MAHQPNQILSTTGTVTKTRRRRRGARGRTISRSKAATGMPSLTGNGNVSLGSASYDNLSAHIRGVCEGFALANGITSQQAFTGLRKSLNW